MTIPRAHAAEIGVRGKPFYERRTNTGAFAVKTVTATRLMDERRLISPFCHCASAITYSGCHSQSSERSCLEQIDGIWNCLQIISFRNILAHCYDTVGYRIVWGIIEGSLPELLEDQHELLGS